MLILLCESGCIGERCAVLANVSGMCVFCGVGLGIFVNSCLGIWPQIEPH